jgi:hypothetical protein
MGRHATDHQVLVFLDLDPVIANLSLSNRSQTMAGAYHGSTQGRMSSSKVHALRAC